MLDIERLHNVVLSGRQMGRTTTMLVEAIQNADFLKFGGRVVIFFHDKRYAFQIAEKFEEMSKELGFKIIKRLKRDTFLINGTTYVLEGFFNPESIIGTEDNTVFFFDHFHLEIMSPEEIKTMNYVLGEQL